MKEKKFNSCLVISKQITIAKKYGTKIKQCEWNFVKKKLQKYEFKIEY
jgi:hypothetical protein